MVQGLCQLPLVHSCLESTANYMVLSVKDTFLPPLLGRHATTAPGLFSLLEPCFRPFMWPSSNSFGARGCSSVGTTTSQTSQNHFWITYMCIGKNSSYFAFNQYFGKMTSMASIISKCGKQCSKSWTSISVASLHCVCHCLKVRRARSAPRGPKE
jgi:hypothetical protein